MRRVRPALLALALAVGCGSEVQKSDPAPAPAKKPAPGTAPAPPAVADDDGGKIVIKGSKHADPEAPRDDPARRNQAKIDELTRQAAEGGVTAKWIDFVSGDGKFAVCVPQKPDEISRDMPGPRGPIVLHAYRISLQKPDIREYVVTWFDLPVGGAPPDIEAFLGRATEAESANLRGKVIVAKSISLDGNPGRDSRIEIVGPKDSTIARLRLYVVGATRAYQITTVTPKGEADGRDVTKFLDSFKVTK